MTRHRGEFVQITQGYRLPGADAAQQIISKSMDGLRDEVLASAIQERDNMLDEAARILNEAQQQAEQLLTRGLEERLDGVLEEGRQHGYEVGYQQGIENARQETLALLEGANQIVDKAAFAEQRMLHQFKATAAELLTQLCNRILGQHVWAQPECLLTMIDQAIEQLSITTQVRLVISQDLLEHVKQSIGDADGPEHALLESRFKRLVWVADAQLERTQVFLQSREGQFDLSPQTQVATLVKAITPTLTP